MLGALYERAIGSVPPSYVENVFRAKRWASLAPREDKFFMDMPGTTCSMEIHPSEVKYLLSAHKDERQVRLYSVGDHRGMEGSHEAMAVYRTGLVRSAHWYPPDPGLFAIREGRKVGGKVSVWDTETGTQQQVLKKSLLQANDVDWAPDKDLLAIAGEPLTSANFSGLEVVDLASGVTSIALPCKSPHSVHWSPRIPFQMVSAGCSLSIWDIRRSGHSALLHVFDQSKIAVPLADNTGEPGTLLDIGFVWDQRLGKSGVDSRKPKRRRRNLDERRNYSACRFSTDGRHIISVDWPRPSLRLWDIMTGHCLVPRYRECLNRHVTARFGFCTSSESSTLFVSGEYGLHSFDLLSGEYLQSLGAAPAGSVICCSPKYEELYACKTDIRTFCSQLYTVGGGEPAAQPPSFVPESDDDDWT